MSGVVTDDVGVRDVMVFHGEEKVFYRGGEEGTVSIPFTAEPELTPGSNMVYVLARDHRGLSATWSRHTWLEEAESTAQAMPGRAGERGPEPGGVCGARTFAVGPTRVRAARSTPQEEPMASAPRSRSVSPSSAPALEPRLRPRPRRPPRRAPRRPRRPRAGRRRPRRAVRAGLHR